jgi:hypothetical protein
MVNKYSLATLGALTPSVAAHRAMNLPPNVRVGDLKAIPTAVAQLGDRPHPSTPTQTARLK